MALDIAEEFVAVALASLELTVSVSDAVAETEAVTVRLPLPEYGKHEVRILVKNVERVS